MSDQQKAPTSIDEYNERYHANARYEGLGLDTASVMPCPFCAAPNFATVRVIDTAEALQVERTCVECGRSGKAFVMSDENTMAVEFVQTGGDDLPDWFYPPIRRIDR